MGYFFVSFENSLAIVWLADFCDHLVEMPSGSLRGVSSAGVSGVAASSGASTGGACVTVLSLPWPPSVAVRAAK
jgi:hypothetical protein